MHKVHERPVTMTQLRQAGFPVVPGRLYVRKEWLPKRRLSLEALHRKLAVFRGSLAEEVARARDAE